MGGEEDLSEVISFLYWIYQKWIRKSKQERGKNECKSITLFYCGGRI